MPKRSSHCISLSVILINFVSKMGKNYYPQLFLEKCEFIAKQKKTSRYINNDIETSSDDLDRAASIEENFQEQNR